MAKGFESAWKRLKRVLPIIGIAILAYLIISSGPEKILNTLYTIDPLYFALSIVMLIPYLLIQAYKWRYILTKQRIRLDFITTFKLHMIGVFYGILTPGRIGTFMKITYLKDRIGKSVSECTSNVVLDKVTDVFALFILALIGIVMLVEHVSNLFLLIIALFVLFLVGCIFLMKKELSRKALKIVYRLLVPAKLKGEAQQAFHSFYENMPRVRQLIIPFLLAILSWVVGYSSNYFIALSLGIDIPYYILVVILPIATLIGLIPVTVSGLGTREASMVGLLALFGVTAEKAILLSLLAYIVASVFSAVIAMISIARLKRI